MSYNDLEKNDVSSSVYYVQDPDDNNNLLSLHSEYLKYNKAQSLSKKIKKYR